MTRTDDKPGCVFCIAETIGEGRPLTLIGGFGIAVLEVLQEAGCPAAVERIGWPDRFIEHGSNVDDLRAAHGLGPNEIYRRVLDRWRRQNAERVELGT